MEKKEEIWKDIEGFEGYYQVSNFGRVKSLEREVITSWSYKGTQRLKERILKLSMKPYPRGNLVKDGKCTNFRVHRLVAKAFIPNPNNLPEVNHIDCNKQNNHVSNLEWCDRKYNSQHAVKNGRLNMRFGSSRSGAKLSAEQVDEIRSIFPLYRQVDLAKMYNVSPTTINYVINGVHYGRQ